MSEFHGGRGLDHGLVRPRAELRREQRQGRPQALPAGVHQVSRRGVHEGIGVADGRAEFRLHQPKALRDGSRERRIVQREGERAHGRNLAASVASASTGPGRTPSTIVAAAVMPIATADRPSDVTTVVESPSGAVKNISTIRRT